jgi:N-methylhydantoinase A
MAFNGPAIVEQMDATTVIPPSARCRIDDAGNLHVMLGEVQ